MTKIIDEPDTAEHKDLVGSKKRRKNAAMERKNVMSSEEDAVLWKIPGSITVEAAMVVPLALMVIFLLISLDFYVHDKSYYTLCALETALTGSSYGRMDPENGEAQAKEKLGALIKSHRMPTEIARGNVNVTEDQTEVSFEGAVYRLWGAGAWEYKVSGTVETVNPKKRIWQIRMVKNVIQ